MTIRSLVAVFVAVFLVLMLAAPLMEAQQKGIKQVPMSRTDRTDGAAMYKAYCASCHGMDGKGNGPAAPALKEPATDLTILSKNNGGTFPEMQVSYVIGMDTSVAAHGSKDMPVWGVLLREMERGQKGFQQLRVYNLVKHIESMQQK
ncbi:MAG: c-type cytochrome [Bryobacterales bacterium]|jgi:mono/diheme cytochrome c family protein|nr:c-type cytochrome [Bryobacterales bacterium]